MSDTGLMAHLLGLDRERLAVGGMIGPLFENFVVMELKKQITWSVTKPQMFHFHTQTGQEVDIVLEDRSGNLVGIEVKASATVHTHDFKGLRALAETTDRRFLRGVVLYTGTESIPFGESLTALPVQLLWQWDAKIQDPIPMLLRTLSKKTKCSLPDLWYSRNVNAEDP